MIRVRLPAQLRSLAHIDGEVVVSVAGPATLATVLDALEAAVPELAGTIRDRATGARRPMIRIFAEGEDLSDTAMTTPLPTAVASGDAALVVIGAIAGG